jgi:hypothetical protein
MMQMDGQQVTAFWSSRRTHKYFCGKEPMAKMYGFNGRFEVISIKWICSNDLKTSNHLLKKLKIKLLKFLGLRKNTHLIWELKAI